MNLFIVCNWHNQTATTSNKLIHNKLKLLVDEMSKKRKFLEITQTSKKEVRNTLVGFLDLPVLCIQHICKYLVLNRNDKLLLRDYAIVETVGIDSYEGWILPSDRDRYIDCMARKHAVYNLRLASASIWKRFGMAIIQGDGTLSKTIKILPRLAHFLRVSVVFSNAKKKESRPPGNYQRNGHLHFYESLFYHTCFAIAK